jgi:hypothetical protein
MMTFLILARESNLTETIRLVLLLGGILIRGVTVLPAPKILLIGSPRHNPSESRGRRPQPFGNSTELRSLMLAVRTPGAVELMTKSERMISLGAGIVPECQYHCIRIAIWVHPGNEMT